MKIQLLKESLVATIVILTITYLLNLISLKFEMAKPIRQEFGDFDVYDMVYSGKTAREGYRDSNIILVQVGDSRAEIAAQLRKVQSLNPKVIGLDVTFAGARDSLTDQQLITAIDSTPSLVTGYRLDLDSNAELGINAGLLNPELLRRNGGYINFVGDENVAIRYYSPLMKLNDTSHYSFTARILSKISPSRFNELQSRNKPVEIINYFYNLGHYNSFTADEFDYYFETGQLADQFRDKVVLVGFFTKPPSPQVLEDLKFTPMNEKISGKAYPDTYGVVIHANILSSSIAGRFATLASLWTSYISSFIFCFLLIMFMLSLYSRSSHPPHWKFLVIQIPAIIVIVYAFLLYFDHTRIKVQLLPVIVSLVVSVEFLFVYKFIAKLLNKYFRYETIFSTGHS